MALQNLRSSTAHKRPVATSLSDGQIAINTNAASPGIFFKNSSNVLTKVGPIQIGTSAPNSSPAGSAGNAVGEQWLDTSGSTVVLKVWDGSAWQQQNKFSAVAGTAAAPSYSFSGDPNTGIYSPGADQVAVATNGVGRLFVDASGNVGVGTTSPSDFLHVMESSASAATPSLGSVALFERAANAGITIATGNTGLSTLFFADSDSPSIGRIVYDHSSDNLQIYTNGSSERARIDSSGRLLVGTSTSRLVEDFAGNGPQGLIQIEAVNSAAIMSIISAGTADASRGGTLSLGRHRNATVGGTPTVVQSGDLLGAICFAGGDGTDMRTKGASIACQVDGTPGANDMPGRLVFSTTADGASSPTERMRIESNGRTKFSRSAYGVETAITAGSFDMAVSNYWSAGAVAIPNPTNALAGMAGLIRVTAAPTSWGSNFDFPGGAAPTIASFPAIIPYYASGASTIMMGTPVEGIA
jgi:hypothetical protein